MRSSALFGLYRSRIFLSRCSRTNSKLPIRWVSGVTLTASGVNSMAATFVCIDAHTCGNPVRLVAEGGPVLQGANMSEKRQHFLREYDWIRKGLMFEPRGHDMMSGSILYPPSDPANDV